MTDISVILCTYNRCESLEHAVESVLACAMSGSYNWELLVVDNNSKDSTGLVVEELVARYPGRIRYLFEPRQGKSNALNSGIRESAGDILAFVDDDVTVDPNWLQNLALVLQKQEWSGVGGRILPEKNFTPPAWLSLKGRYALAPLAIFDLGVQAGETSEPPFGTNMAFRRQVFEKIGGFRTDLGPCPGSEIRSEDTEFGYRALSAGFRLWYEPSAIVYHSLNPERLRKKYFLAWWYDKSRADIRQDGVPSGSRFVIAGVPLFLLRRLIFWSLRWMCSLQEERRFSCKLNAWKVAGSIHECRRQSVLGTRETREAISDAVRSTGGKGQ
jgi:glycosyltransferase involved in cell wall biosynthesis